MLKIAGLTSKEKASQNQSNLVDFKQPLEKPPKLGYRFRFCGIIDKTVEQLKIMDKVIYPISYSPKFYAQILKFGPKYSQFVGHICSKIVEQNVLYLMTLGVLEPYRRLGIGSRLLKRLEDIVFQHNQDPKNKKIKKIRFHVQVSNNGACEFYKKYGFEVVKTEKNYYEKVEIKDAFVFEKDLKYPNGYDEKLNFVDMK